MSQEKEKTVEVNIGEGDNSRKVNITIKRPDGKVNNKAQIVHSKVFGECIREGIMTKQELVNILEKRGIWSKEKQTQQEELVESIQDATKQLYQNHRKRKTSEGKKIALDIKKDRFKLQQLIAEKMAMEQNTAESISDNAKFDFLVAECTYYTDKKDQKVYKDVDDYNANSDSEIAFVAAAHLAQMMYALDKDFEANLPENRFLKKYDYVNDDYQLVDKDGFSVNFEGKRIDEEGYLLNDDGKRVDDEGSLLDDDGRYVFSAEYTPDEKTTATKTKTKKSTTG